MNHRDDDPQTAVWQALRAIRETAPRVHCITNTVVMGFTANALLAVGARPSMSMDPREVADFAGGAGALLVNLGTLDPIRLEAIPIAIEAAGSAGRPWVLDPVMVHWSAPRLAHAKQMLTGAPRVIRGNAAEISALAGGTDDPVPRLARALGTVLACTGAVDVVSDGERTLEIGNGHPLMDRVTGMGCICSALVASFLAVCDDPVTAAAGALATLGVAGEIAGERSAGPGTFASAILDALHGMDEPTLTARGALLDAA